jgi:hypothetical protein
LLDLLNITSWMPRKNVPKESIEPAVFANEKSHINLLECFALLSLFSLTED